jgi:hypothetical protein
MKKEDKIREKDFKIWREKARFIIYPQYQKSGKRGGRTECVSRACFPSGKAA